MRRLLQVLVISATVFATRCSAGLGQSQPGEQQPPPPTSSPQTPPTGTADNNGDPAADLDGFLRFITGNNEPEVRRLGASKLLQAGTDGAIQRLIGVLTGPNGQAAKMAVCNSIAEFDQPPPPLVDPLFELLGDDQPDLSDAATRALRRFDRSAVIARLRSLALDTAQSPARRAATVRALGAWGDELDAIAALVAIVEANDPELRRATSAALREATGLAFAGPDQWTRWWDGQKDVSDTEWLRMRNRQLRDQLHVVNNDRAALTRQLIETLRDLHVRTPEDERPALLLRFLQHSRPAVRSFALDMVNVRITDRKEIGPEIKARLGELISDPDESVRRSAADIVGDLRLTEFVEGLLAALSKEQDASVRAVQVRALGELDDSRAIPEIIARLDDRESVVVHQAARALGNLVGRDHARPEDVAAATEALLGRFARLPIGEDEPREAFIVAMGQMGSSAFLGVFRGELAADRSPRIRQAAIRALADSGASTAADDIRPLLAVAEPRVRLAVVDGLATCGRSDADLAELIKHLDSPAEQDQTVRERAWESVKAIAQRLPVERQMEFAARFAHPGNLTDQRRRLDLLKAAESRFAQLDVQARIDALGGMGQARLELGEFAAAAGRFDQAARLVTDRHSRQFEELASRAVAMYLKSGEDEKALAQIDDDTADDTEEPNEFGDGLRRLILVEIDRRLETGDHAAALRLLDMAEPRIGSRRDFGAQLAERRKQAVELRNAARAAEIDRLLDTVVSDPEAETKLFNFGLEVLPKLHQKLTASPTTAPTAPDPAEARLVAVAKRLLAPDWAGYEPGCPPEERDAALRRLQALIHKNHPGPAASSSPSSRPSTNPAPPERH